jgi:nucleoside-triphosphatase
MRFEVKKNILLTGSPGVGKTTLIRNVLREIRKFNPTGFYTEEIRDKGIRKGFSLTSTAGDSAILAHENIQSRFRVGKYGVDVSIFEKFIGKIPFHDEAGRLIVIDEIGKMECFSTMFRELVMELLSSEKLVVATVALKGSGLIEHVKTRPDVELIMIKKDNRNQLLPGILDHIDHWRT